MRRLLTTFFHPFLSGRIILASMVLLMHLSVWPQNHETYKDNQHNNFEWQAKINQIDREQYDSIIDAAISVLYLNPDSARSLSLELLDKISYDQWEIKIRILNLAGTSYHLQADYSSALDYYFEALSIAFAHDNGSRTANLYNNIGIAHLNTGSYKEGYEFFLKALSIYQSMDQKRNISSTQNNIGLLFRDLNNSTRALSNFTMALEGFTQAQDSVGIAAALNNLASVYVQDSLWQQAYAYFDKASEIAEISNNSFGLSVANQGLAIVYQNQNDIQKAIDHFYNSISIAEKTNQPFVKAKAFLGLSNIYIAAENTAKALDYSRQALQIANEIQNKALEYECYKTLSEVHEKKENFEKSLLYHKLYHDQKEELLNQSILHQVHNIELEHLNQANHLQQLEIERKELSISKKNNLLLFTSIIFFLTLAGLYFFYLSRRQREQVKLQKTIIELTEKKSLAAVDAEIQERKRIGQELHDSLGQLLSVAGLNMSVLHKKKTISENRKEELLNAAIYSIDVAFNEVRNISHNLAPSLLSERGLKGALKNLSDQVNQSNHIHMTFETFGLNGSLNRLVENTLFRSIQEIVNNTIKHSKANNLSFQVAQGANEITLMAEDNGIGFDACNFSQNGGHGLTHMRTRIENLNGSMHIDSNPKRGTITSIVIPLIPSSNDQTNH